MPTLRVATDDDAILVSLIAFNAQAERLLAHSVGGSLAIGGRAKLTSWTGKDGAEKHGLSIVVDQLASAARRAEADRRRATAQAEGRA